MKFHRDVSTITIYFLLVLLWMALFTNASEEKNQIIIQALDNDISQNNLEILATMEKDDLYNTIQALHQKRLNSSLAQPPMPNREVKKNIFLLVLFVSPHNHKIAHPYIINRGVTLIINFALKLCCYLCLYKHFSLSLALSFLTIC